MSQEYQTGLAPRHLLHAVERATRVGIACVDEDGLQTYVSPAFCRMLGYSPEELIGQRAPFAYWPPDELERITDAFTRTMEGRAPDDGFELRFVHKNGAPVDVHFKVVRVRDDAGAPAGWLASVDDVTSRKRAEAQLAEAQRLAKIGSWVWEIASGEVTWTPELYRQYGRDPDSFTPSFEGFLENVVPEDRPRVQEAIRCAVEEGAGYDLDIRIRRPDGSLCVQQVLGRVERDHAGTPLRMFGTSQDITEQKRLEQERLDETIHRIAISFSQEHDEQRLLQRITDESTALADADFGAFFSNRQSENGDSYMLYTLSGASREDFRDFPMPRATPIFAPTFSGSEIVRCYDVRADPRYGQWGPQPEGHLPVVSYLAVPVKSRSGEVLGGLFFAHREAGRFTARHERIMTALAMHAAIALDNARLYGRLRSSEESAHAARVDAEHAAAILAEQRTVLELIASGAGLGETLNRLVRTIEKLAGSVLYGSVLLFDRESRCLRHGAAPSLPAAYNEAIDGVAIGPSVGSCGTAAHDDREVLVTDIAVDPLWVDFKDVAVEHGLRACWSTPIRSSAGEVLGTFAIYYPTPRAPTLAERQLVGALNRTASIAIERTRFEEALREADQRKDEFLALLGHELRNPLAPILTALELMELRGSGHEKERAAIDRHVRHMVQLVDDLLDISRVTRGKLELEIKPVGLDSVLADAAEMAAPLIEEREHHLSIASSAGTFVVDGDRIRLAQVFSNLLTNAAKYTERGGNIDVGARRDGDEVVITVKDDGLGIDPELLPRVFEPFTQGKRGIDRRQGGLGLGLPLVENLVGLHRGTVSAASEGEGRGTEVTVRLPLSAAAEVAPPQARVRDRPPGGAASRSVLVVDDNRDAAELMGVFLESRGYRVTVLHDSVAALAAAKANPFDVAVVDIGLPVMDGYELGRRLQELAPLRLVAVTGYGAASDLQRSREAGFAAHLVKPVRTEALLAALDEATAEAS